MGKICFWPWLWRQREFTWKIRNNRKDKLDELDMTKKNVIRGWRKKSYWNHTRDVQLAYEKIFTQKNYSSSQEPESCHRTGGQKKKTSHPSWKFIVLSLLVMRYPSWILNRKTLVLRFFLLSKCFLQKWMWLLKILGRKLKQREVLPNVFLNLKSRYHKGFARNVILLITRNNQTEKEFKKIINKKGISHKFNELRPLYLSVFFVLYYIVLSLELSKHNEIFGKN